MIQAPKAPTGPTRDYALVDVTFIRGMAAHSRACSLVWRWGAYEIISGNRVIARRGTLDAGKAAQLEYIERGYISEVLS